MKTFTERLESLREEAMNILFKKIEPYGEINVERFGVEEPEFGIITAITYDYSFRIKGDDFDYHIKNLSTETICIIVDELLINE